MCDNTYIRNQRKVKIMKLEKFQAAIKGQKTITISHWTDGIYKHEKKTRTIEVSDIRILPTSKLIGYTFYTHLNDSQHLGSCVDVLIRVADVTEVKSVCSVEEWNAGCDAFDALHDLVGLRGM
tara:strand:+ start:559 stop:927 length:369 start_codon:yes stop_codon:yes gene_type:complete